MARERQQYSGDRAHQLHAVHLVFGETRLPARFLRTWSQGMTEDGYFLDTWPAYDRLARLIERQLDLSGWGPILDHGLEFNFDCLHHFNYTSRCKDWRCLTSGPWFRPCRAPSSACRHRQPRPQRPHGSRPITLRRPRRAG